VINPQELRKEIGASGGNASAGNTSVGNVSAGGVRISLLFFSLQLCDP